MCCEKQAGVVVMRVSRTCSRTAQRTQETPKGTHFYLQGSFFIRDGNPLLEGGIIGMSHRCCCAHLS